MATSILNKLFSANRINRFNKGRKRRSIQLHVESLEDRAVPAGISVTTLGTGLQIDGTDGNDHVEVAKENGMVIISENNQVVTSVSSFRFVNIVFYGHEGDDYFNNTSSMFTTAYGGEGNDTLIGSSSGDVLVGGDEAAEAALRLDGGYDFRSAGSDYLNWGGKDEKWFYGNKSVFGFDAAKEQGWFFILPGGEVYEWNGVKDSAEGTLLGKLDVRFYEQPQKLYLGIESAYAYSGSGNHFVDQSAIETDAELGLFKDGDYYYNWSGRAEKWLRGNSGDWYYILPTGVMHQWNHDSDDLFVRRLDVAYYEQPHLLHDAADLELARDYGLYNTGNIWLNLHGQQEKWLKGYGDQWFYIVPKGDVFHWNGSVSNSELVGNVHPSFYEQVEKLQAAANSVFIGVGDRSDRFNQDAVQLDSEYELRSTGNYWFDLTGKQEKWLKGKGDLWYQVLPNGEVYRLNADSSLTQVSLFIDPKFHDHIYKLHNAADLHLIREHGLYRTSNDWYNYGGKQEKWLKGNGDEWYYIIPDGSIYLSDNGAIAGANLIGTVDATFYHDLNKIHAATDMSDTDVLYGGNGNDQLAGGIGNDKIYGEAGNDKLYGFATEKVDWRFTPDNDTLKGGNHDDFLYGRGGDDKLYGENGDDQLFGDSGVDKIWGGAGADTLHGGSGNDFLNGELGDDQIFGNAGNDVLWGLGDNDILYGEAGNDTLYGHDGDDQLYGGTGADYLEDGKGYNVYIPNDNRADGAEDVIKIADKDDRDFVLASREDKIDESGSSQLAEVQYAEDLPIGVKSIQIGIFSEAVFGGGVGGSFGLVVDWSGAHVQVYDFYSTYASFGVQLEVGSGILFAYYYGGYDKVQGESWTLAGAFGVEGRGSIYAQPNPLTIPIGYAHTFGHGIGPLPLTPSATWVYSETTVSAL